LEGCETILSGPVCLGTLKALGLAVLRFKPWILEIWVRNYNRVKRTWRSVWRGWLL